jgi:protein TonB
LRRVLFICSSNAEKELNYGDSLSPRSRFGYALAAAAAGHALVILGLAFEAPSLQSSPATPALEVVLATEGLEAPPDEEAEYFGLEDRRGDGNTREQVRAVMPEPWSEPSPGDDIAGTDDEEPSPQSGSVERDLVATRRNEEQKVTQDLMPEQPERVAAAARRTLTLAPVATSRDPRERFLSVNTRQTLFAEYLVDWKNKVERVGTLNFPDAARRLSSEGGPVLEVALRSDGSVANIRIVQTSGDGSLDAAAVRILRLASPFDPFPRELRDRYRILRFAYEWRFHEGRMFGTVSPGG